METIEIIDRLEQILAHISLLQSRFAEELAQVRPQYRHSAKNLIAYVALRHFDIRDLQEELAYRGMSSLGRAERNVQATLRIVRKALRKIQFDEDYDIDQERAAFADSKQRAQLHIDDLLGEDTRGRRTRIMVTLPTEAAREYQLVRDLVASGMDIARINCAHDDSTLWLQMIRHLKQAAADTGHSCKLLFDLAGPKLRTGSLQSGPGVVRIRPKRNAIGNVIAPRQIRLVPPGKLWSLGSRAAIPVPQECIDAAAIGDRIAFRDTRGKRRNLEVVAKDEQGLKLDCYKKAYIASGTVLTLKPGPDGKTANYAVGPLPASENPIVLRQGDALILHRDSKPGAPARLNADGKVIEPAHIACRQPEVFKSVAVRDPIKFDDGKIEGIVEAVGDEQLVVRISQAKPAGSRLRADKGINFPASDITLASLTEADRAHLDFVITHADAVGMSFVRKPADIIALQAALRNRGAGSIGTVTKIETLAAFDNLPRLLLASMQRYPAAVMIARGDLAVECGWERLAELQEEILWMCEAAELPVIWATQVLEQQTKSGRPSRAEITDAAMSQRADCVMLNKGAHVVAAVTMLDDILRRMQAHQRKKTPQLRKLSISEI